MLLLAAAGLGGSASAQVTSHPNLSAQLLVSARQNDLAAVERVLANGAAPNARNRLGKTALLLAAEKGNVALAQRMLDAGADVNLASLEGVTPLMAASYGGQQHWTVWDVASVRVALDDGWGNAAPTAVTSFPGRWARAR